MNYSCWSGGSNWLLNLLFRNNSVIQLSPKGHCVKHCGDKYFTTRISISVHKCHQYKVTIKLLLLQAQ